MHPNIALPEATSIPVHLLAKAEVEGFLASRPPALGALAKLHEFKGQAGRALLVAGADGALAEVLFGLGGGLDPMSLGALPAKLPAGDYHLANPPADAGAAQAALTSFLLGGYVFDRFKTKDARAARLVPPPGASAADAARVARAVWMGRDLVNLPAGHLGPSQLEAAALDVAQRTGASVEVIRGDDLLTENYPLIHAVGRAAADPPRLVILRLTPDGAREDAPRLGIVGKGVTFDSGGLNIKPGAGMALMKKDMGGAACALALFQMLAEARIDARLSVYLPIVENAISGNAFRPGDVIVSRKGLSVEIDNTDAEGRLILADAVTRACEDGQDVLIDMATLTGAARVALGPDLPPLFCDDDAFAGEILAAGKALGDPLWRMPLWKPYDDDFDSSVADFKNGGGAFAGSIIGALFIARFVDAPVWAHLDVFCWAPKEKPGRPLGGEVHAVRALDLALRQRFGSAAG